MRAHKLELGLETDRRLLDTTSRAGIETRRLGGTGPGQGIVGRVHLQRGGADGRGRGGDTSALEDAGYALSGGGREGGRGGGREGRERGERGRESAHIISHSANKHSTLLLQGVRPEWSGENIGGCGSLNTSHSSAGKAVHYHSLLGVCHDLCYDPEGRVLAGPLHPAVGVVQNREGTLAVADLELVLLFQHFDQRSLTWEEERGREKGGERWREMGGEGERDGRRGGEREDRDGRRRGGERREERGGERREERGGERWEERGRERGQRWEEERGGDVRMSGRRETFDRCTCVYLAQAVGSRMLLVWHKQATHELAF